MTKKKNRLREQAVDTNHTSILAQILEHTKRGWHVLPIWPVKEGRCGCGQENCSSPGKHPVGKHVPRGLKDATTDPKKITAWAKSCPGCNWAVRTGPESGIWVLDIDTNKGGADSLASLESEHCRLPDTVEAVTGSGGSHRIFQYPGPRVPSTTEKLGLGLDIKGDDGYIVVAPSIHVCGGQYKWDIGPDERDPAPAPQWLLDLVSAPAESSSSRTKQFEFDPSGAQEVAIAKAAINALSSARADNRDTWIKVGMILKRIDPGPAMLEVWDAWSSKSLKYEDGECAQKWAGLKPNGSLNLPTLVRWAQEDTGGQFKVDSAKANNERTNRPKIIPFEPFPTHVLPEPVRSFVSSAAAALGCDPSFVALPALVAIGAVIGNTHRIELKSSWHEPCVLMDSNRRRARHSEESGHRRGDAPHTTFTGRSHESIPRGAQTVRGRQGEA